MPKTAEAYRALISARFTALADEKYKLFQEKLIPGTKMTYGVRLPEIRKLAKEILKEDPHAFLITYQNEDPGKLSLINTGYEEAMLYGFVLVGLKMALPEKLPLIHQFLSRIDNWSICDSFCISFRMTDAEREEMWQFMLPLFQHQQTYFVRFALVMMLFHYVDAQHISTNLSLLAEVSHEDYYVKMAVAWAVSVCYVKFPAETRRLLEKKTLDKFTQNKAIQKIRESYRVGSEDKAALLAFKV